MHVDGIGGVDFYLSKSHYIPAVAASIISESPILSFNVV
jgi:hypothetical protein